MRRTIRNRALLGVWASCIFLSEHTHGFTSSRRQKLFFQRDDHPDRLVVVAGGKSPEFFYSWGSRLLIQSKRGSADDSSDVEGDEDASSNPTGKSKRLEEDIAKKLTHSRDKAISALSQPTASSSSSSDSETESRKSSNSVGDNNKGRTISKRLQGGGGGRRPQRNINRDTLLPKATPLGFQKVPEPKRKSKFEDDMLDSVFSLLPPPIEGTMSTSNLSNDDDSLSNGLSSWEDFLGAGSTQPGRSSSFKPSSFRRGEKSPTSDQTRTPRGNLNRAALSNPSSKSTATGTPSGPRSSVSKGTNTKDRLPSIADLFPPDFSSALGRDEDFSIDDEDSFGNDESTAPPPATLDGVLPVSDLFYRSSQSMTEDIEEQASRGDDEELPFSAEQSDRLATGNRIRVRRNQAKVSTSMPTKPSRQGRKPSSRKMIRRGMEMLVGGVPINADPPQRYVDLLYVHKEAQKADWHEVITINTRDFGPMLHGPSVGLLSKMEQGLYCEHFVYYTTKWGVCPKDLRTILRSSGSASADREDVDDGEYEEEEAELDDNIAVGPSASFEPLVSSSNTEASYDTRATNTTENSAQGFGRLTSFTSKTQVDPDDEESALEAILGGELVFAIGVSREELESGDSLSEVPVLERVLAKGIAASTELSGFSVVFTKMVLTDLEDGTTLISGEFRLNLKDNQSMSYGEMERKAHRINSSLAQAMDEGDMQLALAAAAREETGWPEAVRNRVVEEFLFDDDDVDGPWDDKDSEEGEEEVEAASNDADEIDQGTANNSKNNGNESPISGDNAPSLNEVEGPFGLPGSVEHHKDDIFLGGGNDGVFWDFSEKNALNSPYGGALGLRLVDAVVERAKERQPRVIAIGDVHGCIDELQELLRQCSYRPGDLVVFLGDLVSKGPDSISVVQMAREIGAMGVRGNHDFEVIRWHQAIKSGVDPPVVGSEHFHIASCLSKADMKWMYSLPWYISSRELGVLFVHAGFVSGIRLAKQNPRLMMNMRSILPDGTVTSKFFNNWPWARLWDGPQTVLFGHDADRGLQQYEHAIGLDTGCVYGGRLTACILPEKRLVSVSARREYFKYRRKHYD